MAWTEKQQEAIDLRGSSLIVSAAAGSGKTSVLVERLINIIADAKTAVPADTIVVVTFTKDAASEVKQRLKSELQKRIDRNKEDLWLSKQLILINKAKISTISSFCFSILRDYASKLDIDPNFKVADENESNICKYNVCNNVLTLWNSERPGDMQFLIDRLGSGSDRVVENLIFELDNFLNNLAFPENWIEKVGMDLDRDFEDTEACKAYRKKLEEDIAAAEKLIEKARQYALSVSLSKPDKIPAVIEGDRAVFETVKTAVTEGKKLSVQPKFAALYRGRFIPDDPYALEQVKLIREKYKDPKKGSIAKIIRDYTALELHGKKDHELSKKLFGLILELYRDYQAALTEEKREKNILFFEDGENLVLDLLAESSGDRIIVKDEAENIRRSISLIMIDEYQDANDKQDIIFRLLSKGCCFREGRLCYGSNVFIVGDEKQSIYGFRGSNPENFSRTIRTADGEIMKPVYLNHNFRSSECVIDSVNSFFEYYFTGFSKTIAYGENEKLHYACRSYDSLDREANKSEIICFDEDEAGVIASRIAGMIAEGHTVIEKDGSQRPCQPSDFCILFRKRSKFGDYEKKLRDYRIPFKKTESTGYLESIEIIILINMLKVINNPLNDIALSSVLMSPMFSFTSDDMLEIRNVKKGLALMKCLLLMEEGEVPCPERLSLKVENFLSTLRQLRSYAVFHTLTQLIRRIYDVTNYPVLVKNYFEDESKLSNLRMMLHYAENYTESNGVRSSLFGFLMYLENIEGINESQRRNVIRFKTNTGFDSLNAVELKTMHASKGLEYAFVFIADCSSAFSKRSQRGKMMLSETGIGFNINDPEEYTNHNTLVYNSIVAGKQASELDEELRIFYVALTRARQKLFIALENNNKQSTEITDITETRSYKEWLWNYINFAGERLPFVISYGESRKTESAAKEEAVREYQKDLIGGSYSEDDRDEEHFETSIAVSDLLRTKDSDITDYQEKREKEYFFARPGFMREKKARGAEFGTLVHRFFQYCDMKAVCTGERPENIKSDLIRKGLMPEEEVKQIPDGFIRSLAASSVSKEMAALPDDRIHRETQILVKIDDILKVHSCRIAERFRGSQTLLKGAVDLYYETDEGLVIVDYKTDRFSHEEDFVREYSDQLRLYASSMELITGKRIKKALLFSFVLKKEIGVELES